LHIHTHCNCLDGENQINVGCKKEAGLEQL
jgi:hypothetical protein